MNYFSFCHKNVVRSKNETISFQAFNEFINQNVEKFQKKRVSFLRKMRAA